MPLRLKIDPTWQGHRLLVRAYSCLDPGFVQHNVDATATKIGEVLLEPQVASFDYHEASLGFPHLVNEELTVKTDHRQLQAPEAPYLVMLTIGDDEPEAAKRLDWASAVVRSHWGPNALAGLQAEFWIEPNGNHSFFSPVMENPLYSPRPNITRQNLGELARRVAKMKGLEPAVQSRLETAARWYRKATLSRGVDQIIALWTAFEALTTSKDPMDDLVSMAANCYGLSQKAATQLGFGLFHGLRSEIVHEGWSGPVHADIITHFELHWANLHWHAAAGVHAEPPPVQGHDVDALAELRRCCRAAAGRPDVK